MEKETIYKEGNIIKIENKIFEVAYITTETATMALIPCKKSTLEPTRKSPNKFIDINLLCEYEHELIK